MGREERGNSSRSALGGDHGRRPMRAIFIAKTFSPRFKEPFQSFVLEVFYPDHRLADKHLVSSRGKLGRREC